MKAVTLSPAAEAALVRELGIAAGSIPLSVAEFAERFSGSSSRRTVATVRAQIAARIIPAVRAGNSFTIHLPTYLAGVRIGKGGGL